MKHAQSLPAILLVSISTAVAAPVFQADPTPEGVTTDIWDLSQGSQVIFSSPQHGCCGGSDPRAAFGFTSGFVETTHAIWQDGAAGVTDFLEWQTLQPIDLSAIALHLADDGSTNRSASDFKFYASQDGMNFSLVSTGVIPADGGGYLNNPLLITDSALVGTASAVRSFRLEMTRATGAGTRVVELDATGVATAPAKAFLDRLAFNDATNSLTGRGGAARDDEGAGLGSGYTFSSAVAGGADTVRDAFGGNHGAVEPDTFIFGDGVADNGNLIMGDGGETVDFIQWHTAQKVSLAGFRIGLAGDGGGLDRATELVRFFIGGVQVDLSDNNGLSGDLTRFFAGGAAVGDDFRVEFTRSTSAGGRVFEIDAITAASTGWIGTGGNTNWSSAGNWSGAGPAAGERDLFLGRTYKAAGATGTVTARNDLVGYVGNRIAFQDSDVAGTSLDGTLSNDTAFMVTGNGFTLSEIGANFPLIENNSFLTQTFNLSAGQTITLNDATNHKAEINPTNGDLVFSATTPIDLAGTTQLQISGSSGKTATFGGAISSSGNGGANGVALVGNSIVVFAAANTYAGETNVNGGMLVLGHVNALQSSTLDTGAAGPQSVIFTVAGPTTYSLGGLRGADDLDIGANTIQVGANGQSTVYSGTLSGAGGGVTKVGLGTLTITGSAAHTGPTRVLGGTLKFEIPVFYNGFASDIENQSVVAFNLSGFFNRNITGTGTITRNAGEFILGGGTTADTQSWVLNGGRTFYNTQVNLGAGPIAVGSGGKLIKNSGGDLTLVNAVTLTDGGGLNNRYNGTLTIGNVGLPGSGFVVFNLDDQPTSKLSLGGPAVALSGAGLTISVGGAGGNGTVGEVTLSQAFVGAGTVTKTGPGKLTLSGPQNYDTLTTEAGRTDLTSTLGTGTSTINANVQTNISVSQTLAALNIGDGVEVTFGDLPVGFASGGSKPSVLLAADHAPAVPEPGSFALLLLASALLARRRGK